MKRLFCLRSCASLWGFWLGENFKDSGRKEMKKGEWKSQLLKEGASVFSTTTTRQQKEQEALQADLYEQIGRLQMELEWVKKKATQ